MVIIAVPKAAGPQASVSVSFICPVWEGLEVKMALAQSSKSMPVLANRNSFHARATAAAAHMCTAQPCGPAPILYP